MRISVRNVSRLGYAIIEITPCLQNRAPIVEIDLLASRNRPFRSALAHIVPAIAGLEWIAALREIFEISRVWQGFSSPIVIFRA